MLAFRVAAVTLLAIVAFVVPACGARSQLITSPDATAAPDSLDVGTVADSRTDAPASDDVPFVEPRSHSLSLGTWTSCVVRGDGAYCWGMNANGQLGDGTTVDRDVPTRIADLSDTAVEFALGQWFTCVRLRDGSVACAGVIGNAPTQHSRFEHIEGVTDAVQLGAGATAVCAVRRNGHVVCWGDSPAMPGTNDCELGGWREPAEVPGITDAVEVSLGEFHACARTRHGEVVCWGCNRHGQLGDGSRIASTVPHAAGDLTNAVSIALQGEHSCAVRADGRTFCWGWNAYSQIFDAIAGDDVLTPREVPGVDPAIGVATSVFNTCYTFADGRVGCRGSMPSSGTGGGCMGMLAGAGSRDVNGLGSVSQFAIGNWHFCGLRGDDAVLCWGCNGFGEVGTGGTNVVPEPVVILR